MCRDYISLVFIIFDRSDVQLVYIISVLKVNTTVWCQFGCSWTQHNTMQLDYYDTSYTIL